MSNKRYNQLLEDARASFKYQMQGLELTAGQQRAARAAFNNAITPLMNEVDELQDDLRRWRTQGAPNRCRRCGRELLLGLDTTGVCSLCI